MASAHLPEVLFTPEGLAACARHLCSSSVPPVEGSSQDSSCGLGRHWNVTQEGSSQETASDQRPCQDLGICRLQPEVTSLHRKGGGAPSLSLQTLQLNSPGLPFFAVNCPLAPWQWEKTNLPVVKGKKRAAPVSGEHVWPQERATPRSDEALLLGSLLTITSLNAG